MTWQELLQAALVLVVRYLVVWFFSLIGFNLDPALLDTLVAAIVVYLLALFGIEVVRGIRTGFKSQRLFR